MTRKHVTHDSWTGKPGGVISTVTIGYDSIQFEQETAPGADLYDLFYVNPSTGISIVPGDTGGGFDLLTVPGQPGVLFINGIARAQDPVGATDLTTKQWVQANAGGRFVSQHKWGTGA